MKKKKDKKKVHLEDLLIILIIIVIGTYIYSKEIFPYLSNQKLFFLIIALFILLLCNASIGKDLEKRVEKLEKE